MPRVSNYVTPRIILYKKYDYFKSSSISFYYKFFFRQIRLNFFLFYFLKYELQKLKLKPIYTKIFSTNFTYFINVFFINPTKKIFFFRWRRIKFFLFKFRHLSLNFIKKRTINHLKKLIKKKYFIHYYKVVINKISIIKNFGHLFRKIKFKKKLKKLKLRKNIKILKTLRKLDLKKIKTKKKHKNIKNIKKIKFKKKLKKLKLRKNIKILKTLRKLRKFFFLTKKKNEQRSKFKKYCYLFNLKKMKNQNKLICRVNLLKTFLKIPNKLFLILSLLIKLKIKNFFFSTKFYKTLSKFYIFFILNYFQKNIKKKKLNKKKINNNASFLFLNKFVFHSFYLIKQILFIKFLFIKTKFTIMLRQLFKEDIKINLLFYKPIRRILTKIVLSKYSSSLRKSFFRKMIMFDKKKIDILINYIKYTSYFFKNTSIINISKKLALNHLFRKKFSSYFSKQIKKKKKKILKFFVLSLLFNDVQLFSAIIVKFLKRVKKGHDKFFFIWLKEIKYWFTWLNQYFLNGPKMFKIIISGKLNNKMKTTTRVMHGSNFLKTSTLEHILNYQANYVYGRAGVYGLKIFFG